LGGSDTIGLPDNMTLTQIMYANADPYNYLYFENDALCALILNPDNYAIHGHCQLLNSGKSFEIEYCGKHGHVWKTIDMDLLNTLDIDSPVGDSSMEIRQDHIELIKKTSLFTISYSVRVYYTREFAAVTPDPDGFIAQMIAETNQGYSISSVPLKVKLHCAELASISDVYERKRALLNFVHMKDSIEDLRGSADVVMLLVRNMSTCGISYFNGIATGNTVSVVRKNCALSLFTAGHEIGHNFGLQHEPQSATNLFHPEGHGFLIQPKINTTEGYRTIMALSHKGHKTRLNLYSNEAIFLYTNTTVGDKKSKNVHVLNENRFSMAAIGDESIMCPSKVAKKSEELKINSPPSSNSTGNQTDPSRVFTVTTPKGLLDGSPDGSSNSTGNQTDPSGVFTVTTPKSLPDVSPDGSLDQNKINAPPSSNSTGNQTDPSRVFTVTTPKGFPDDSPDGSLNQNKINGPPSSNSTGNQTDPSRVFNVTESTTKPSSTTNLSLQTLKNFDITNNTNGSNKTKTFSLCSQADSFPVLISLIQEKVTRNNGIHHCSLCSQADSFPVLISLIQEKVTRNNGIHHCENECQDRRDCEYWTYNTFHKECYIWIFGYESYRTSTGWRSGPKICGSLPEFHCKESNKRFLLSYLAVNSDHIEDCKSKCLSSPDCHYWSFLELTSTNLIRCRLYSLQRAQGGWVSGLYDC